MDKKYLLKAYQETDYIVPELNLTLQIGAFSFDLQKVLERFHAKSWCFITAWNPFSMETSREINQLQNSRLKQALKSFKIFEASGVPIQSNWEAEASFFVLDIDFETSIKLAKEFQQNAILFGYHYEKIDLYWVD